MKHSPFTEKVSAFIKYASTDLGNEVKWLHRHLDDFDDTTVMPIDENTLFESLHAIMQSKDWDPQHQKLILDVRIKDNNGFKLGFPTTWGEVIAENQEEGEPPSINLCHTPHLRELIPTGSSFSSRILNGELFESLVDQGLTEFCLMYRTTPYDDADELSGIWGRTISATWIGQSD